MIREITLWWEWLTRMISVINFMMTMSKTNDQEDHFIDDYDHNEWTDQCMTTMINTYDYVEWSLYDNEKIHTVWLEWSQYYDNDKNLWLEWSYYYDNDINLWLEWSHYYDYDKNIWFDWSPAEPGLFILTLDSIKDSRTVSRVFIPPPPCHNSSHILGYIKEHWPGVNIPKGGGRMAKRGK